MNSSDFFNAMNTGYIVLALVGVAGAILFYAQQVGKKNDHDSKKN